MRQYGDIVRFQVGPFLTLHLLTHPDYISYVLQTHYQNFPKDVSYELFKEVMGQGLVTSKGEHWQRQRRLIQPAFNHERLTTSVSAEIITATAAMLVDWQAQYENSPAFNVAIEMTKLARSIIVRTLFRTEVEVEVDTVQRTFFEAAPWALISGRH